MNFIKISSVSVCALIFMALFVPTTYLQIKIPFLLVAILSTSALGLENNRLWDKTTIYACSVLAIFGFLNSVHGQFNDAPGAVRVLSVMFAWPLLYGFLSIFANQPEAILSLSKLFLATLFFIIVYSFLYIGHESGIVPDLLYFELDQGQIIGFYEGFYEYNLYSISSLLFLVPFAFHRALNLYYKSEISIKTVSLLIATILLVVLTGRRAVQLVLMMTPIFIITSHIILDIKLNKSNQKKPIKVFYKIILLIFGGLAIIYFLTKMTIDMDVLWSIFIDGFDFVEGESSFARTAQFDSLMQAWLNGNILFGAGNGAAVDVVRSDEFSWAYELTYIYLLFSTGIVGVIFYFGWFGWGLLRVRNGLQNTPTIAPYVAPMITGVFGLAIGAATNPYFGKFDYLWIIMLPHLIAGGLKYQQVNRFK